MNPYVEQQVEAFAKKYGPAALAIERDFGLPAENVLAHAALESAWGEKAYGNNFFGYKAPSKWTGKKQLLTTFEYLSTPDQGHLFPQVLEISKSTKVPGKWYYRVKDWFKAYSTPEEGFADYAKLLTGKRYAPALQFKNEPYRYAWKLGDLGYYTADKDYYGKAFASRAEWFKQKLQEL